MEREGPNTQKALYSTSEWEKLKLKYKPHIKWTKLDPAIIKKTRID